MRVSERAAKGHGWSFLAFLRADYALFSTPEGLAIVDLSNACERIAYELIESHAGKAPSQNLLVPSLLKIESHLKETLEQNMDFFTAQGFVVAAFGTDCYRLEAVPEWLKSQNGFYGTPEALFISELEALHEAPRASDEGLKHQNAARAAAREARHSITHALPALALIDKLLTCKNPLKSPAGEPTFWHIGNEELRKRFQAR